MNVETLIKRYLELSLLTKDDDCWVIKNYIKNPPRYYRLMELISLCKAYNVILDFDNKLIKPSITLKEEQLNQILKLWNYDHFGNDWLTRYNEYFNLLLKYRKEVFIRIQNFNSNVLAIPNNLIGIGHINIHETNKKISEQLNKVDKTLIYIINPTNKIISEEELTQNYQYEKVDLEKIDLEWF